MQVESAGGGSTGTASSSVAPVGGAADVDLAGVGEVGVLQAMAERASSNDSTRVMVRDIWCSWWKEHHRYELCS
jgi:hypothetical protein